MTELEILFAFLRGLLPDDVTVMALALIPVVTAMVGLAKLIPWVKARLKWAAPVLSLVLGLLAGLIMIGLNLVGVGAGLLIGIGAIGGFSAVKNVVQSARSPDSERKAA